MGQIVTVLLLNMVSFALSITTNVNALNTAVGGPTFDPNSFGGKVALGAYCLSCGLTVFILMAFNRDVRLEILRTFRCGKRSSNSVIPIDAIAVAF